MKPGDIVFYYPPGDAASGLNPLTDVYRTPVRLHQVVEVNEDGTFAYKVLFPDGSINPFSDTCTDNLQSDYIVLFPRKLDEVIKNNKRIIAATQILTTPIYPATNPETATISISIQTIKGRRVLIREESPEVFTVIFLDSPKP